MRWSCSGLWPWGSSCRRSIPRGTYAPQARWIRAQIGAEDRIGIYYPERGRNKMGAFTYHSGALVSLLDSEADVVAFFHEHPASLVLVHEEVAERPAGEHDGRTGRRGSSARDGRRTTTVRRVGGS